MDARRSQSLNRLPSSLNFIVDALLKNPPEEGRTQAAKQGVPGGQVYKATLPLDSTEYETLKDFFDGSVGHIFSCGAQDQEELLMHFIHAPRKLSRAPQAPAATETARYLCEVVMAKVR